MTMLNTCKCGGEVYIRYEMEPILGTHYTAVCEECGAVYPLKADNKLDAVREWNGCKGVGDVQTTNEEWFCNLDTEDKAREISDMTAQGYWSEELVEKWLREIHK